MSKNNILILIKILNWERYQRNKKNKNYDCLFNVYVTTKFFEDSKIMRLTAHAKLLFLYFICKAGQQNAPLMQIDLQIIRNSLRTDVRILTKALAQIEQFKLVEIFHADNQVTNSTQLNTTQLNNAPHGASENVFLIPEEKSKASSKTMRVKKTKFDLDAIYKIYPRKRGKSLGFKKLEKIISDEKTYAAVLTGVQNYAEECRIKKTEEQYICGFSVFVNQERWIDYQESTRKRNPEMEKIIAELGGQNV